MVARERGPHRVVFYKGFQKELDRLPVRDAQKILTAVRALAEEPRPSGCKKLAGGDNLWRIRVGDYRVIYSIDDRVLLVAVLKVGNRRDVYE